VRTFTIVFAMVVLNLLGAGIWNAYRSAVQQDRAKTHFRHAQRERRAYSVSLPVALDGRIEAAGPGLS
jgi:hypothetical protein